MEQNKTFTFVILITVIGIATVIGMIVSELPAKYRLSTEGIETEGVVTAKERDQHNYIWVEYKVNNLNFKTGTNVGFLNKSFEAVKIGEKVPVFYNSSVPGEAVAGNPRKYLRSSIIMTFFIAITPLVSFVGYILKNRFSNSSNKK